MEFMLLALGGGAIVWSRSKNAKNIDKMIQGYSGKNIIFTFFLK